MIVFIILGAYLGAGLMALGLLDLLTKRIRRRIADASLETQTKLLVSGSSVGHKEAMLLTVLALWLFWPVALYAVVTSHKENADG